MSRVPGSILGSASMLYFKRMGVGYVLWRSGERGCFSGSMLRHPFPLRDQLHDCIVSDTLRLSVYITKAPETAGTGVGGRRGREGGI